MNGQMATGKWSHSRVCADHGYHGVLYICESYPPDVKAMIKAMGRRWAGFAPRHPWAMDEWVAA